jgi:hypothetical protein
MMRILLCEKASWSQTACIWASACGSKSVVNTIAVLWAPLMVIILFSVVFLLVHPPKSGGFLRYALWGLGLFRVYLPDCW